MKKIFVCSPLRGDTTAVVDSNLRLAENLCHAAMTLEGVAVFAPHLHYTLFLDDEVPEERLLGITAGQSFLDACDEIWVYAHRGISNGMAAEIELASRLEMPIRINPMCWEEVEP